METDSPRSRSNRKLNGISQERKILEGDVEFQILTTALTEGKYMWECHLSVPHGTHLGPRKIGWVAIGRKREFQ